VALTTPRAGHSKHDNIPQPVEKIRRKKPAIKAYESPEIRQSSAWLEMKSTARYGGIKIEQLSDFSTIRACYPQLLGSYPQLGGRERLTVTPYMVV
jgi:hypothetical protein